MDLSAKFEKYLKEHKENYIKNYLCDWEVAHIEETWDKIKVTDQLIEIFREVNLDKEGTILGKIKYLVPDIEQFLIDLAVGSIEDL